MTPADSSQTLCFTATFPPEEQYATTAGELAGKISLASGFADDDAGAWATLIQGAFAKALAGPAADGSTPIDVKLCAGPDAVEASVTCGSVSLLKESRPRPK